MCSSDLLWVSDQVQIDRDYEELAARCFFAPSISIDLEDPKAGEQMSQWIAQKTAGKIHAAPDLGPEDRMVLMDTLYFYGGWRYPFREADTQKDRFTLESGEEVSCLFLNMHWSTKIGHFNCIFLHTICDYCPDAYVSLYCFGVKYPSEYAGRSSLKNFI